MGRRWGCREPLCIELSLPDREFFDWEGVTEPAATRACQYPYMETFGVPLNLKHILEISGFEDLSTVLLFKHSTTTFKAEANVTDLQLRDPERIRQFTARQLTKFRRNAEDKFLWWITFIEEPGNSARLAAVFENHGLERVEGDLKYFNLTHSSRMSDIYGRLVVDWFASQGFHHEAASTAGNKVVRSISDRPALFFPGFEQTNLTFEQLESIVRNRDVHRDWHNALKSVGAVYLITYRPPGEPSQLYVGSATGVGGLLGRWTDYVDSGHAGNKKLQELIGLSSSAFEYFHFSVLRIFSKNASWRDVLASEAHFKEVLQSRVNNLNAN